MFMFENNVEQKGTLSYKLITEWEFMGDAPGEIDTDNVVIAVRNSLVG